jgi:hypothetical protein
MKSIQRGTDIWDIAGGGGRESDKGGMCGAQHGDLPRMEEEVRRDGVSEAKDSEHWKKRTRGNRGDLDAISALYEPNATMVPQPDQIAEGCARDEAPHFVIPEKHRWVRNKLLGKP